MKRSARSRSGLRTTGATALAASALLALTLASTAEARCSYSGGEQVFQRWGDQHHYVLVKDGGLEADGAGWSLSHGAVTGAGNESEYLHSPGDTRSLSLPGGSVATSPPICVALDTPVLRTMVRNTGDPSSRLRATVVYPLLGLIQTRVVTSISSGSKWSPSPYINPTLGLSTVVGTLLPASIQIRFEPLDSKGEWQVDDLYVDPYSRR
jgi:hypothetical protein